MSFLRTLSSKVSAYQNAVCWSTTQSGTLATMGSSPQLPVLGLNEAAISQDAPAESATIVAAEPATPALALELPVVSSDFAASGRSRSVKRAADATMLYRDLWLQP